MPEEQTPVTAIVVGGSNGAMQSQLLETPIGQRDVVIKVVSPVAAVIVGGLIAFLTIWLGLITGGMTTDVIPYHDFLDLAKKSASLSVAGTVVWVAKDVLALLTKLREKLPLI